MKFEENQRRFLVRWFSQIESTDEAGVVSKGLRDWFR
jgi:hypothetical protein